MFVVNVIAKKSRKKIFSNKLLLWCDVKILFYFFKRNFSFLCFKCKFIYLMDLGSIKLMKNSPGKLKSLTEFMQQHELTDWKIGQSADCMLWCVSNVVFPKSTNRKCNTKTLHTHKHRRRYGYIHQHTLIGTAPESKNEKVHVSFSLFRTHIYNHSMSCLSVLQSLLAIYMYARTSRFMP